ncbi:MAG: MAPEG family protein [Pseudomonadales bacterium]
MQITLLYAGLLSIVLFVLSYRVVQIRRQGVTLGDGGDPTLQRRIRAHGNFTEYVPIILIMIALLEANQVPAYLLHVLGLALLIARCLHGYAMSFTESFFFGRFWGTAITFLLLVVCGALCIYQAVL